MRLDHRPYALARAAELLDAAYARHFLHPHFARVGRGCGFAYPRSIRVFGGPISLGDHVQLSSLADSPIRLGVWGVEPGLGEITLGDFTVINPGARINSADRIVVGRNALFAAGVTMTDSDWHDPYDRVFTPGKHAPIVLRDNVWVGEAAILCKGVTVGENAIVGAGAVVTRNVEAFTVVAGNPAKEIGKLDPKARFVTRSDALTDPERYAHDVRETQRALLGHNTLRGFLRYLLWPRRGD